MVVAKTVARTSRGLIGGAKNVRNEAGFQLWPRLAAFEVKPCDRRSDRQEERLGRLGLSSVPSNLSLAIGDAAGTGLVWPQCSRILLYTALKDGLIKA
jgi:hypothetical protein